MKTRQAAVVADVDAIQDDFELNEYLPFRLAVAATAVSRLLARRFNEAHGLGISEWRVLSVIGKQGVVSPSVIGNMAAMDKVKVSRAGANLVARGMVKQSPDPRDGRGRLLRLTRKGATAYRGLLAIARETEEELSRGMTKADWSSLKNALEKLRNHTRSIAGDFPDAEAAD
ncbi:MAG TPA: MarR family winged helix-turn-helix transcriptional regulator [Acetobacteraceae bacterium]|nr:MarR family winged helix-turn-helix transcriptional regulator [Acetobacteraceae bacterium]